jgi:cyclopropane-fatty-acyl-phospholipid synthase
VHYAKTLAEWRRRFHDAAIDVTRTYGDSFVRAWDLYLAGSQAAFVTGCMQLFQIVFARGDSNRVSWTRAA